MTPCHPCHSVPGPPGLLCFQSWIIPGIPMQSPVPCAALSWGHWVCFASGAGPSLGHPSQALSAMLLCPRVTGSALLPVLLPRPGTEPGQSCCWWRRGESMPCWQGKAALWHLCQSLCPGCWLAWGGGCSSTVCQGSLCQPHLGELQPHCSAGSGLALPSSIVK